MATVDTSMYRQNPLKSMQDYTDQYDQAALRQQQIQSNALSFQDRQRALAESQALRNALQSGIDPRTPEGRQKLITVAPNAAGAVIKSLTDAEHVQAQTGLNLAQTSKAAEETKALTWKQQIEKANKAISDIAALSSPDEAIKGITEQVKSGALDMQKATALLQSIPQDPTQFGQWQRKMLLGILDAKDRLAATKLTVVMERAGGSIVPANTNPDAGPIGTISGAASIPITQSEDNAATNARAAADAAAGRGMQLKIAEMGDKRARDIASMTDTREREKAKDKPEKNLTEDQGKATSWLERMNQAEAAILESPAEALTSIGSAGGMLGATIGSLPFVGGSSFGKMARNAAESPARQKVRTAQEAWVAGLLRSDTGAAYKDMEKDDIIRTFFPQPGDDESQTVFKQSLRDGVRRAMTVRAGPGVERLNKVPKADVPVKVETDADYNALPKGARFITPDGKTGTKR